MSGTPVQALNDGTRLPAVGLGTYPLDDAAAEEAVAGALELGYRLVDTALNYGNETGTGRGIARSGVPREEVLVTTKVPGRHHGYEETLASFEESRARLGVEYVDLYLIHWPLPRVDKYVDTWKAMIRLREDGLVRSIGVSNFTATQPGAAGAGDGRAALGEPGRDASAAPAGGAAGGARGEGHRHGELEPAGPGPRGAGGPLDRGHRGGPRGEPRAGGAALAHPAGRGADPEVGGPAYSARTSICSGSN